MWELPKGGLIGNTLRLVRYISDKQIPLYAASACYFVMLALFPMLVLLLGLLRYTGLDARSLTDAIQGFLPEALLPSAQKLILNTYRNTTGTILSVSALTALWSAGRGVYGLLKGLNAIYEVGEDRGYWYTRWVSVVYTVAFLAVLTLTLVLNVFGNTIVEYVPEQYPLLELLAQIVDLRFFVLLVLQTGLFTAVFMVLPNRRNRFWDSLPGALLAAIGWLIFSDLYSLYVENFTSYANIYGSVYAVALSMLWLYCCISILFYGGALNHYLAKHDG